MQKPAGIADEQGLFPAGTVNGKVPQRLRELSERRQRYAHPQQDGPAGNGQSWK
jgi:hypothetical protein